MYSFVKQSLFSRLILLVTLFTVITPHQTFTSTYQSSNVEHLKVNLMTYDDVLNILELLEQESEKLNRYDENEIAKALAYFATQGLSEEKADSASELSRDIEELFSEDNSPVYWDPEEQMSPDDYPWVETLSSYGYGAVQCGWVKKKWKKTKKFAKKHKTEIIIGAAVVVVVAVVVVATAGAATPVAGAASGGASAGGAAAGTAAAGGAALASKKKKEEVKDPPQTFQSPQSLPQAARDDVLVMKEGLHAIPQKESTLPETARATANQTANQLITRAGQTAAQTRPTYPCERAIQAAGQFKDCMLNPALHNFTPGIYQASASNALNAGQPQQALSHLNKAIECNPQNKGAYLDRALVHYQMGHTSKTAADFSQLEDYDPIAIRDQMLENSQRNTLLGMASGAKKAGEGLVNTVTHPVQTAKEFVIGAAGAIKDFSNDPAGFSQEVYDSCKEWCQEISELPMEDSSFAIGEAIGQAATSAAMGAKGAKLATKATSKLSKAKKATTLITVEEKVKKVSSSPKKSSATAGGSRGGVAAKSKGNSQTKQIPTTKSDYSGQWTPLKNSGKPIDLESYIKAGNAHDRQGLTMVGRGIDKHGNRPKSAFPKATGNTAAKNAQGAQQLKSILSDPNVMTKKNKFNGLDFRASDGRGASFYSDGSFRGFLQPSPGGTAQ